MTGSRRDAAKPKVSPALLVLLGIVAVGGLLYLITTLGGGPSTQTAPPVPTPSASPTATGGGSTPAASPSPEASPTSVPETFEVFESKDPFRPLVVAAAEPPPTGEGAPPAPSPSPGAGAGGAPAPSGGTVIELLDIVDAPEGGTAKAQVRIGNTVYTVAPGETFASTFKVLSISGTCATMLNGDDKFTVCEGEQIIK
jgi:hypothetical protein